VIRLLNKEVFVERDLQGLVAVVTGSGGGIGRGIALKLAERGAGVVVNDIVEHDLVESVKAIESNEGKALGVPADVSRKDQVERLFETSFEKFGRIDILVNNAGIIDDALIEEMQEEQWDRVIDVNLKGSFLCSQSAIPFMRRHQYGRIINISAEDIFFGQIGMVNYHSSKYGLFGLTIAVAHEMARWVREDGADMTCNCITPGYLGTEMRTKGPMSDLRQEIREWIPMGRECDPREDTGNTVAFLASKEASYITASAFNAGGGLFLSLIY
jgi:NAD(P)-dependent dehydrogenase (short-subunit alcohol dehydrogenase family)